jgi:UDP-N-acetylmuramoylalanine--D-glutamate ligase
VGGNVGYALAGMPGEIAPDATVVAELSSFQLEHIERFRPKVGMLLNLTEDHIDRHGTYRGYADAKLRIFEHQSDGDIALLCADDQGILDELAAGRIGGGGRRVWFSSVPGREAGPGAEPLVAGVGRDGVLWVDAGGARTPLCRAADLALRGEHNLQNSLAAAAACCALGVPPESAARTLRTFGGVPHRLQVAGVVGGVTYVNDSKATNVDATLKALTAYSGPVHLILGGYDKGAAYDRLAAATEGLVRQVLLIGATAPQLEAAFVARRAAGAQRATPWVLCGDLEAAVILAAREAEPGDTVLLSPACASWDQYRDYEQRGEHFLELVNHLRGADAS